MNTQDFSAPRANTSPTSADNLPCIFGRYELRRLIALGGMAEIFLARAHTGGIERDYVIKRILPRFSTSREFVNMFIDEARITIGLDHPHVVRMFDFGQVDGAYYMALEYVDGCDLVDVLRAQRTRGTGVPAPVAAQIVRDVLRGLDHAHRLRDARGNIRRIVHRDVSPQNILLGWNGDVKLGDFGIADARDKISRTELGTVKGKFSYMSPEQASGALLDGRSDVWSVGVVLWEMLVGRRLFAGDSPVETMMRVGGEILDPPSKHRAEIPAALDSIVMRALMRPVDDRYGSAGAMADELDAFLHNERAAPDALARFLSTLGIEETASAPRRRDGGSLRSREAATIELPVDAELRRLHVELQREQNLWTLVDMAERSMALGDARAALAAARTAAMVFAHRRLLVPAICALHCVRSLMSEHDMRRDLEFLASLRNHSRKRLLEILDIVDTIGILAHVRSADPNGLGAEHTSEAVPYQASPLFGKVTADDFVRLALVAVVEEHSAGSAVVDEGERGDSLYAVGRGRVLVHCQPRAKTDSGVGSSDERVYVASLGEGDFFGEIGLLTRKPRTASVEAASNVMLLRLDRQALDTLLLGDASFRAPLVEFYKDRVIDLLLARNPLVGLLPPDVRKRLVQRSEICRFQDEDHIVRAGELDERVFFVMAGEVEVYHDEQGLPVFIDKLREAQHFGEMGALRQGPRMASVRAIGDVELLVVDGSTLSDVLRERPEVLQLFESAMRQRENTTRELIEETNRVFMGV